MGSCDLSSFWLSKSKPLKLTCREHRFLKSIPTNKVIFLNHSCVLVDSGKTKILCDPWFEGTAFQDGWSLLYDQSHDINDLDFDYIWISHEHPDHFSIPTLNQLNKPQKFLYQETEDKKVKIWLESKGHSVPELPHK